MENPPSSSTRSLTATKQWNAPVMHVVRAADAQISLRNSTIDGGVGIGGIGVTTFGS
ncbi:hypothetical protein [Terriglobus roseus]|uniref:Uncharacterized protein n=1 Tax=Terriglobus roseus TaxID=392734 RepID=A0A1H4ND28_9BACT|nr:hypothetical protein [Terriglobus roseus]SEB93159.1 hypothetical protein SAMN05443244_2215 [Terriglobus roseus]